MLHRSTQVILLTLAILAAASATLFCPSARADDGPVALRAVPQYASVAQGGTLVIAVEMDHKEHYHSWPAKEVKLPDDIDESSIRTEVGPAQDKDGQPVLSAWIARVIGTQFPKASPGKVPDPTGAKPTIEVPLYSGKAITYLRLQVKPDATLGEQTFIVRVYSQSCNEQTCDMPREELREVKVKVVAKGTTDLGNPNEPTLFEGLKPLSSAAPTIPIPKPATPDAPKVATPAGAGTTRAPVDTDHALKPLTKPFAGATPASPVNPAPIAGKITANPTAAPPASGATLFGVDIGTNIIVLAFASMLGGFILNLTPCVLPVIPIKVMSLTQHATSRSHALMLGLWMAAGVVAFWTAIGLPMAIISRQLDPSQYIFGTWWICLFIGVAVALLGLGIMGLFTLNLPQSVYMVETKADSPFGAFLFGVLAAVLGLPCFGFMAGGLLAAASALPAVSIMTIFVCLGIGMAAPYLVLSIWPQLLRFIPRTGPASELVKQVLGILMIAGAAYFVTAGIQVLLDEFPYLAGSMVWWAVGFFIAVASLWLIIRTWQISKNFLRRGVFTLLAVAMSAGIVYFAMGRVRVDRASFVEREQAMAAASVGRTTTTAELPAGVWFEYKPESLAAVRASGRPVFLDFTASWCITCKAFKASTLDPLKSEFKKRGVVLLEVNCSVNNSPGSKLLRELNRTGVPAWVVYAPGAETPRIVSVEPSTATVLAALDAAGIVSPVATTSTLPPSKPSDSAH
jgi:thiol:disulfide interchange protein